MRHLFAVGLMGLAGIASVLQAEAAPRKPTAVKAAPAKATTGDDLTRANQELDAFNRRTAQSGDLATKPELAAESADRQLKVVEATTHERLTGGFAQCERSLALLADIKLKLAAAKSPKGGAKGLSAAALAPLEQRRIAALDRTILLEARVLTDVPMDLIELTGLGAVDALLSDEAGRRAKAIKQLLQQLSPAAKPLVKELPKQIDEANSSAIYTLGNQTFGALSAGDPDCIAMGRNDAAWYGTLLYAATLAADGRYKILPSNDLDSADGHEAFDRLYGALLDYAKAVEDKKSCPAAVRTPMSPADAAALARTQLAAGRVVYASEQPLRELGWGLNGAADERKSQQTVVRNQKLEFDKHARAGSQAFDRYRAQSALARGTSAAIQSLASAQSELAAAVSAGTDLVKKRAALREAEDHIAELLKQAEQTRDTAKLEAKKSHDAASAVAAAAARETVPQKPSPADLTRQTRTTSALATLKDSARRADATALRMSDAVSKLAQASGLVSVAAYGKAMASARAEDERLATDLTALKAKLKQAQEFAQAPLAVAPAGCDPHKVKWDTVKVAAMPDQAGLEKVDYADTDGNGALEVFLHYHGTINGSASGDFSRIVVFDMGADCKPRQLDEMDGGYFAETRLVDNVYYVDSSVLGPNDAACCPSGSDHSAYRIKNGKLVAAPASATGAKASTKATKQVSAVRPQSCSAERGAKKAQELVNQCLQISMATNPPCNASNPCALIEEEIQRNCAAGVQAPFCDQFKNK